MPCHNKEYRLLDVNEVAMLRLAGKVLPVLQEAHLYRLYRSPLVSRVSGVTSSQGHGEVMCCVSAQSARKYSTGCRSHILPNKIEKFIFEIIIFAR